MFYLIKKSFLRSLPAFKRLNSVRMLERKVIHSYNLPHFLFYFLPLRIRMLFRSFHKDSVVSTRMTRVFHQDQTKSLEAAANVAQG